MIQCGLQAVPGLRLHRVDTLNQEQSGNCDKAANANTDTRSVNRDRADASEPSFHFIYFPVKEQVTLNDYGLNDYTH